MVANLERVPILPHPKEVAVLPPLHREVMDALASAALEVEYTPDRERQKLVLGRLSWDSVIADIREHLGTGRNNSEGQGKMLRGKVFEMLINADPTFGERSALEQELLALAHNPDAFGLGTELGYHRNPDMAFLMVQKDDGVEIIGVGESKLGLLNERSYKQLSETGFARGVKALVEIVNTLEDPEAHNLVEVARARVQLPEGMPLLTVSDDFTQLLVVPANRKAEWASTLINRREFSVEGRQKFYEMLSDIKRVRVAKAAFSTAEVGAVAHTLASHLTQ